ncbi:DHA2 family efflux MFS transporter permease subunit [Lactobacillus ultunensis]|uniref:Drug resistance MFS transporter, drug:H+ antiporter-2 family n=1 Tax=Lactobacillus ultunensis DSM 16047 TaxID=525365 RepID=C2EQP5_9LACO|nr:DHA2 family efflux MFS transporter permease subunit [Lactobacillus ultunensis]EEJ71048.1 drug resistance MFS transporter, drug:H+ antiporter-2 family [Lactobacillus ultunensis DSM 16047]KRL82831.1 MFS family major facilitator transporter, multidrug cation symporter [Lactobacillus ultunensis DSM 16047]QQP28814.1 DHA2 family efflux MFS transporter permease subunit [Lactobacillus ultunensis]
MTTTKRKNIILMMATLLLGSFITTLAETLMNNGLPMIMVETHVNQMNAQWLNTGYMLVAGMIMPLASYFMHRFPLRHLFTMTMSIFLVGSLIATFAPNFLFLLIGRLVQAIAVGINMPLVTNVLTIIIPAKNRGLAIGIAGIIINLGPAIGPTLSGVILEFYSWRMLFIILLPFTVLTLICTQFFVENVLKPEKTAADFPSVAFAIIGLGTLLYSLGRLGESSSNIISTVLFAIVGVIFVAIFIKWQFKIANPLLDLHVFAYSQYRLGILITLLISGAIMAPELMLPLFNQNILKVSPIISGEVMIPSALAMAFLSPLAGRLYDKFGIKKMAIIGSLLGLIMAAPMFFYDAQTSIIWITVFYALRCAGLILCYTPAQVYALNALPQKSVVSGNTIIVTMVQVANSFCTALAVTTKNIVQSHTSSVITGYQWSFGTTILVTLLACLLIFGVKRDVKN